MVGSTKVGTYFVMEYMHYDLKKLMQGMSEDFLIGMFVVHWQSF